MGYLNGRVRVLAKTIAPGSDNTTSYTEVIGLLPQNAYVLGYFGRVKTAFAGVTNPEVSLGVTGDTDRYMPAQSIDAENELMASPAATGTFGKYTVGIKGYCAGMNKEKIDPSAKPIIATFTATTFATKTAGEVEFAIVFVDCN